eukprot:1820235-Rhodomonas_salina.1
MARAQRSNSVDQLFSGFVNLFKAEYAPNSVTVDERRYLEMSVKPDEILKAVEWIEAHYKGLCRVQCCVFCVLPRERNDAVPCFRDGGQGGWDAVTEVGQKIRERGDLRAGGERRWLLSFIHVYLVPALQGKL